MQPSSLNLCLITHPNPLSFPRYERLILKAIKGGVSMVQFRYKQGAPEKIEELANLLMALLQPLGIPVIINDDVALAIKIDADGVHLGQTDMSPITARERLGAGKIIGWSVETMEQVQRANDLTCIDYIAASAVFPSKTKQDCQTFWGLAGLAKLTQQSKHPVVAIGGIDAGNVGAVMHCGVRGVAVISAIHDSANPQQAAHTLITNIQGASDVSANS